MLKFLVMFPVYVACVAAEAGLLKLGTYLIHTYWIPDLPTISYGTAAWVMFVLGALVGVWKTGNAISEEVRKA